MANKTAAASSSEMFRKSWSLYQKMIQSNGMSHVEAYGKLRQTITQSMAGRPFHFLDLACGDASFSSIALQNTSVQRYTGIDLSETALEHARNSIQDKLPVSTKKELLLGDFNDYEHILQEANSSRSSSVCDDDIAKLDVVWVGLSLHHLETDNKVDFMQSVVHNLAKDGFFSIYEPICLPGQSREDYYQRFQAVGTHLWSGLLDEEEQDLLFEHVSTQDLPESQDDWLEIGSEAGFSSGQVLYTDPYGLYSVFCFRP